MELQSSLFFYLYCSHDICIGGGGVSSLERLYCRLPSLAFCLADNQSLLLNRLESHPLVSVLYIDKVDPDNFTNCFVQSLLSVVQSSREYISHPCNTNVNPYGCDSVAELFTSLFNYQQRSFYTVCLEHDSLILSSNQCKSFYTVPYNHSFLTLTPFLLSFLSSNPPFSATFLAF